MRPVKLSFLPMQRWGHLARPVWVAGTLFAADDALNQERGLLDASYWPGGRLVCVRRVWSGSAGSWLRRILVLQPDFQAGLDRPVLRRGGVIFDLGYLSAWRC